MGDPEPASPQEERVDVDLMRQYEGALRRYFSRRLRAADEVDDLVQEAFARLLESGERRDVEYPVAYLFRIASNLLADHGRRRSRSPVHDGLDERTCPAVVEPDQEDARNLADLRAALDAALAGLSPRCRDVFVMRRFGNRTTPEIARSFGITNRMVQKHMTRAMTHIYLCLNGVTSKGASDAE